MEEQKLLRRKQKFLREGNKVQLASTCNDLAGLYLREGKYEQCIQEFLHEAKIYQDMGQKIQYGIANRMIGEVYTTMAEFEKALMYQKIHLAVAQEEKNKLEEQRALATIGRTHLTCAMSDPDCIDALSLKLAHKAFMKSLAICDSLKNINKLDHMDMRARLLLNIGVVQENQGKFDCGIEYMMQAIKICQTNDIYEQLQQGYSTLGLLYSKKEDYSKAISYLNLAYEVASRLADKIPPMVATLVAKADVLFKLADFQSAKRVLLKAYKLKSPNQEERELIQHNLKVVAALCYTEESLLTIADSDFKLKKKLYEKMGDGACELKIFNKAIDYYKKMLEYAELGGEFGKDLIPVYVSLAQTYKDNKQYDLAVEYFQKEYQVSCDNPKESYSTLLNIAQVYELSKKSYEEIAKIYENARSEAHATGVMKLEGKVISRFINFQKQCGKLEEASVLEKELSMMDYIPSDSEDGSDSESGTPNIGDDISISDISDNSEHSENEDFDNTKRTRKRGRGLIFKKNSKGETPLHTACIAGNLTLVRRLVDQGHVINVRDNCGWLPIHEACICGHKEIVELLVQKGADINDRGGMLCNGITPLHDACCNGHLEIIEYLLEQGASVLVQTDDGETPLDMLKVWKEQVSLDPIQQTYYETLFNRMSQILEKTGRTLMDKNTKVRTQKNYILIKSVAHKNENKRNSLENEINPNYTTRKTKSSPCFKSTVSPNFKSKNLTSKSINDSSIYSSRKSISPDYHKVKSVSSSRQSFDYSSDDSLNSSRRSSKNVSPRGKPVGTLRHIIDNGSSDEEPTCSRYLLKEKLKLRTAEVTSSLDACEATQVDRNSDESISDFENSPQSEYKKVMDNLRKRLPEQSSKKPQGLNLEKPSALLGHNEVGDDWLEDDIGINQPKKKRKFGNVIKQTYLNTAGTRTSNSPNKKIRNENGDENDYFNIPSDNEIENDFDIDDRSNDSISSKVLSRKRKNQVSLLKTGFTRRCTSPERTINTSVSSAAKIHKQPKILNFTVPSDILEPDSTTSTTDMNFINSMQTLPPVNRTLYAITVRIENKLWRVPIPANEMSDLTIGWLAKEAAKRYYSKEGLLPTLQLETKEGAILVDEDPLSIVFLSSTQTEEIQSTVLSWNLPPLPERYIEACNILKIDVNSKLREHLEEAQVSLNLNLSNFVLKKLQLTALFRSLNRENNLQYIDLSGANILNEGAQLLCSCLPSLDKLISLNLSLNNITSEGIRHFSSLFANCEKPILRSINEINLSYNLLGKESLQHLANLLNYIKLRKLILIGCNFTDDIFECNPHIVLNFNNLEVLDLSYNEMDTKSICKFISFLNFKMITSLNFAHNFVSDSGILKDICFKLQDFNITNIKYLNLARCKVNDAEIWDFLRFLSTENHLDELNLSYNNDLTSVSLRRILQHTKPPKSLTLESCDNIFLYSNDSLSTIWSFDKCNQNSSPQSIKISLNYEGNKEAELITSMWEEQWGQKAKISKLFSSFIHLSVSS